MRHIAGILLVGISLVFCVTSFAKSHDSCSDATASGGTPENFSGSDSEQLDQRSSEESDDVDSGASSYGFRSNGYGVHRSSGGSDSSGVSWGGRGDSIPGDELH